MLYLFAKWLHIAAIISWMAGILYLYRLLIYHAERGSNDAVHDVLILMSKRLYRYITFPAMIVSFVAGLTMVILAPPILQTGWFHVKFLCVLFLVASTLYAGKLQRRFADREDALPSSKQLRLLNEVPTLLMLIIVAMVVFKPF